MSPDNKLFSNESSSLQFLKKWKKQAINVGKTDGIGPIKIKIKQDDLKK